MKNFIVFLILGIMSTSYGYAQKENYNTSKGYIAKGYDVVSYFDNTATKGDNQFETSYNGIKYKFSSEKNLKTFEASPEKYIPAYGGYCAYAIGVNGKKVGINPRTFEIRNGRLYLFYNSLSINTLSKWRRENTLLLKEKADKNWKNILTTQ